MVEPSDTDLPRIRESATLSGCRVMESYRVIRSDPSWVLFGMAEPVDLPDEG
jgi:hypothetical protein